MLQHLNDSDFSTEIAKPGVAMVDFWAAWCGPCRRLGPIVEQLANDFDGQARIYKVDVEEAQQTAADFGIQSIPCVLFFKDGQLVDRSVGAVPKGVLERKLRDLL
ncbi:MAG: thioredoxin [Bacteroidales bacterium]|nr:thioredoxin [Bacteroidales bacterium]